MNLTILHRLSRLPLQQCKHYHTARYRVTGLPASLTPENYAETPKFGMHDVHCTAWLIEHSYTCDTHTHTHTQNNIRLLSLDSNR